MTVLARIALLLIAIVLASCATTKPDDDQWLRYPPPLISNADDGQVC